MSDISRHLTQWLSNAVGICTGEESDDLTDVVENCRIVGSHILSLDEHASVEDVQQELYSIYKADAISLDNSVFIEYLLVHAVSEDCEQRGEFVEGIMNLETEAQMYLMQVIQDHHSSEEDEDADDAEIDIEEDGEGACDVEETADAEPELVEVIAAVATVAPTQVERNMNVLDQDSGFCAVCIDKDTFIRKLQQEMNQISAKNHDEIRRLKEESSIQANKLYDLDQDLLEKQSIIFENSAVLKEAEGLKEKYEQMVVRNTKLEGQVLELQDEVDLSKPLAAKLDIAEGQVERLRAKLEELVDIKQQLTKESASHSETYDKLVLAEQEVNELRKYKVQVEDYRAQFAETSIEMEELRARLQGSESETLALRDEIAALRGDQSEHRHQTQHLAEELRTTAEQLREKERMNGIGEGMSELNPALMQELNRLKNENRDLFEKLDQSAVDKLESLRKEIADTKCMNESLTKKWIATKDALAKAEREIVSLSHRLHDKETECLALRFQIAEQGRMNEEDVTARMQQHAREIAFLRKAQADLLALTHQGHNTVVGIYSESLAQAHSYLEQTQQEVVDLTSLQANTAESLAETQNELVEAGRKRKCLEMEHLDAIFQLNEDFSVTLENTAKKHKTELTQLQEESQQALAAKQQEMEQTIEMGKKKMQQAVSEERQKTAEMSVHLENEAKRRHTVERAKKIAELEAQRLKLQLNAAMGADAGGDGVKSALQAINDMQQELAEAHAEIAALKSRAPTSSDCGASDDTAKNTASAASSLRAPPARSTRSASTAATQGKGAAEPAFGSLSFSGYIEQSDIAEKKIEQLTREKREQISKNLEEQRERHEVAQKLLVMEKENHALKAELRKITLDKERNERKLNKQLETLAAQSVTNKENVRN